MKEKTQGCSADHGHWIMVQHYPAYLDLNSSSMVQVPVLPVLSLKGSVQVS